MYTQGCKPYLIHDRNWVEPATASDAMETDPRQQQMAPLGFQWVRKSQENRIAGLAGSLEMTPLPGCGGTENGLVWVLGVGAGAAQLGVHSFCSLVFRGQQWGDSLALCLGHM